MDVRSHLEHDVLAWWMANGVDGRDGGVWSCWDNRGARMVSTDKYTWSQGRWAWLTSRVALAARRGVLDVDQAPFAATAVATARFVADHALLPDGTTAYALPSDGSPTGEGAVHRSVYADLFAALGWTGVAQLDDSRDWLGLGRAVLHSAADRYRRHEFLSEPYPTPPDRGTHAMPMMLLNVGEQLVRAGAGEDVLGVVRFAADELDRRYWTATDAVEMPVLDGPADRESLMGRHRCPGHLLEALWFVAHAADLLSGHPVADMGRLGDLAVLACEAGWDSDHGGLLRYVDRDGGRPQGRRTGESYEHLILDTWDTKLWWPHAEAMYALTLLAERTARADLAQWRDRLVGYTLATFPQGAGQEWVQNRRRDGTPLDEVVALPVKDPMHVARALLLMVELERPATPRDAGVPQ